MNENLFFADVTLSICGHLEIEDAMYSALISLQKQLPVDRLFLQFFDEELNSIRTIALATKECGKQIDWITKLSDEAIEELNKLSEYEKTQSPDFVWLFEEKPRNNILTNEIFNYHSSNVASLIVLPLELKQKNITGGGALVLASESEQKFTQHHANLISKLRKPFTIAMSNALKHMELIKLKDLLADNNHYLQRELRKISGDQIIGANFGLKDVMHKMQQVASLDSPVILLGETGVGKDVIANALHYSSSRSEGPFVSVNCGAIPETLIDSELFGHEKGAFTGAISEKRGRFERAHKGTIFLDEIGELPLQAQVRLLKVLQSKEIERVGGVKTIKLDIRIIAATNRNLEQMVSDNKFREDLWFRLNVFPILIPPLRKRNADIPALLLHFINQKSRELKLPGIPTIAPGAIDYLLNYHWPGNVRELENIVERALILNPEGPLYFDHLELSKLKSELHQEDTYDKDLTLDEITSKYILKTLEKTEGKIQGKGGAAEMLGINPSTLRNRMIKLNIDYKKDEDIII